MQEGSVLAAPVKPFGFTPTIVTGTSLSLIDCPSTAGDRANSRSQNSSLITTTRFCGVSERTISGSLCSEPDSIVMGYGSATT